MSRKYCESRHNNDDETVLHAQFAILLFFVNSRSWVESSMRFNWPRVSLLPFSTIFSTQIHSYFSKLFISLIFLFTSSGGCIISEFVVLLSIESWGMFDDELPGQRKWSLRKLPQEFFCKNLWSIHPGSNSGPVASQTRLLTTTLTVFSW